MNLLKIILKLASNKNITAHLDKNVVKVVMLLFILVICVPLSETQKMNLKLAHLMPCLNNLA